MSDQIANRVSDLDRQIMGDPRHPASDSLRRAVEAEAEVERLSAIVEEAIQMCRNANYGATAIYLERKLGAS